MMPGEVVGHVAVVLIQMRMSSSVRAAVPQPTDSGDVNLPRIRPLFRFAEVAAQ